MAGARPVQIIVAELAGFLAHRDVLGWVLFLSMLFFSSLAFTVLENAMSVTFIHRVAIRRCHFIISALIPHGYILCLALGPLLVTLVAGGLQAMGERRVLAFWREWSLGGVSGLLLYLLGLEERIFKRPFSFPMAPRTRQSTALGALQSVFGGGCGLLGVDASAENRPSRPPFAGCPWSPGHFHRFRKPAVAADSTGPGCWVA